ncbi:curli-like amyloid fiber formation chaperone CsgH [Dethiosulfatarculus sandiegensis]|uniref:Curli assembly protein CsgC n=1 Tax=Dethiosulfatarculus sandiegensis TaxID=1429043 RepID=A0A0D2JTN0_9BACT|nr:curli-like amyloid fiber formation chaperone CsgH [Dethiosulfatarculus sandiegensis]KIX12860.1 hypothetical protein X474_17525 [Dethiosulfatarculus sandiegensis]
MDWKYSLIITFFTFAFIMTGSYCRAGEPDSPAWLELNEEKGKLKVVPFCQAPESGEYRYLLKVRKSGASGRSNSSQAGRVFISEGETKSLCRLVLSFNTGDSYELCLSVFYQGRLVACETLLHPLGI